MRPAPMRCSSLAEELGEPMIGSVDVRDRWLLIEDRSAWGSDAVRDLVGSEVAELAKSRRMRILLVRRREGDPADDAVRRVMLVDTRTRKAATRTIGSVDEIDWEAAVDAPVRAFGGSLDGPVFLVCTNGRRDACCALRGRVLVGALATAHPERTWECTHLGGHRFAGNLICLPHGVVYGRVTPADGPRLARAYLDGRVDASLLRGRSAWPAPAQVAEQELRLRTGLDGVDEVALASAEVAGDRATVDLQAAGAVHRFELVAERASAPRPISCRADELEQPMHWSVVRAGVQAIPPQPRST